MNKQTIYILYNRGRIDSWSLSNNPINRFFEVNELNKEDFKYIIKLYENK